MSDEQEYSIRKVLEHYGWELPSRSGGWVTVKCAEHGDKHASARVNYELGAVKCMGCDFGGDVIKIIRDKEGCSYAEAVRIAAEVSGCRVPEVRGSSRGGSAVSRGSRYHNRGGDYVPPRLRNRPAAG